MGQRLVIQIEKNEKIIAALYYHWSAYSTAALAETQKLIEFIKSKNLDDKNAKASDIALCLIRFAENNGGGIDGGKNSNEYNYITSLYPCETFKEKDIDRNEGLIAISENGISELHDWSEGDIYINLDKKTISDYVFSQWYDELDKFNEAYKEYVDEKEYKPFAADEIPVLSVDPNSFSFDDLETLQNELENVQIIAQHAGEFFELIE